MGLRFNNGQGVVRSGVPGVAVSGARAAYLMHYVYLIRSLSAPERTYVGYSSDLRARVRTHNSGGSVHTSRYVPWQLEAYLRR